MRILMTTDAIGGVWTFTQELARGLLQKGCSVALLSLGEEPSEAQREWCCRIAHTRGSSFQFQEAHVPLEWMPENQNAYSDAAPLLMSIARRFQPDLLQSNQYCFGALPLAIPKLLVAHSDVLSWADSCRRGHLEPSPWLSTYCSLVRKGIAGADSIVAPTHWILQAFSQHFALPDATSVIPNGRSLAVGQLWPRKLQAVTAGRLWDEAKNISIFRSITSPIPVLIAGDTSHAIAFDAPDCVSFLGRLSEQDLHALFRASPIYICTSTYEPFGLAPLEAAQCGCAVVANDIPSLREVWKDAALYFSDAASLSDLLWELSCSSARLRAAQQKSLEHARTYSGEQMVHSYLELFQATLARREQPTYAS